MLSVPDALARVLALAPQPLACETVPLSDALDRHAAADVTALLTQPPFAAAAMDGYAVRFADLAPDHPLRLIGESAAGRRYPGHLGPGEAVRIFTGAPLPDGADTVVVQEDTRADGSRVILTGDGPGAPGRHIRAAGLDFCAGDTLIRAGDRLTPARLGLAAAGGHAALPVARRPRVTLLSTGDELVPAGQTPGPDQIVNSNGIMLAALLRQAGAEVRDPGILPDRPEVIRDAIAASSEADILVTVGGASVGDHDHVQAALLAAGADIDFWKIAMRPGKPMMLGQRGRAVVLGLPGNPVSAFVCARLFLLPLVRRFLSPHAPADRWLTGRLDAPLKPNGERDHFMRARVERDGGGWRVTPLGQQDSSLLVPLAAANALALHPAHAPGRPAGAEIRFLPLCDD